MGLPLQVRREIFTGVGQPETFNKTNTLSKNIESSRTQNRILKSTKKANASKQSSKSLFSRYLVHASVIACAVVAVSIGQVNSQSNLVSNNSDSSKTDRTTLITTGAVLSEGAASPISSDISQKARDINSLTVLTTAGDNFLAKKQPVLTAGAPSRDIMQYTVKEGDTLGSLSQKFNITTDTIKWANDITDENSIKPNVQLTILPISGVLYTGTGNDDLTKLAETYNANAGLIDSFNSLDGKSPLNGQKIIIPEGVKPPEVPAPSVSVATTTASTSGGTTAYSVKGLQGAGSIGNTYAYGYCTWYVASRRAVPGNWGNAYTWLSAARGSGYGTGSTPRVGAVAWERGNHVAYVESVNGDTVTVSEMNYWGGGGGWGRRSYRTTSASTFMYIY
jgi:surface antigen